MVSQGAQSECKIDTAETIKATGKDRQRTKATTIKLDLGLKPEKIKLQASKIKQALESDLNEDFQVKKYNQEMSNVDHLPEMKLAIH